MAAVGGAEAAPFREAAPSAAHPEYQKQLHYRGTTPVEEVSRLYACKGAGWGTDTGR